MRRTLTATVCAGLVATSAFLAVRAADAAPSHQAVEAATSPPRSVMFVGNNWAGTADVVDAAGPSPRSAGSTWCRTTPSGWPRSRRTRRGWRTSWPSGSRSARATTSTSTTCSAPTTARWWRSPGRASPTSSGIDLRTGKIVWRFPMRGLPGRPHGRLPRRHPAAGLGLHRQQGRTSSSCAPAGRCASSSPATPRTRATTAGRLADLPRQHRHGSTPRPTRGARADPSKGDQLLPDRRNKDFRSSSSGTSARSCARPATRHGSAVRPMAVAPDERYGVPAGLVLPRVRRVRPRPGRGDCGSCRLPRATTPSRCRGSSTSSTPRTTAWRSTRPARSCAPPGRWMTTSGGAGREPAGAQDLRAADVGDRPYWATDGPRGDECWVSIAATTASTSTTTPDAPRSRRWPSATTRSGSGPGCCPPLPDRPGRPARASSPHPTRAPASRAEAPGEERAPPDGGTGGALSPMSWQV